MSYHPKLFLIIIISLITIAITACNLIFLFLYHHSNNPDDTENGCCTCLDCPECDVCCDCNSPYLNN